jgi:hypothetical protein
MEIPVVLTNLILDFYWSHRTFEKKQELHRELLHLFCIEEIKMFFTELHRQFHVETIHGETIHG